MSAAPHQADSRTHTLTFMTDPSLLTHGPRLVFLKVLAWRISDKVLAASFHICELGMCELSALNFMSVSRVTPGCPRLSWDG